MQIIRHRSYTGRSAVWYGTGTIGLLTLVLAVSFANARFGSLPALVLTMIGFAATTRVLLPRAETWMVGALGEWRVLRDLRDLPDTYVAVTNYVVPNTQRGDVDLVVLGPMGVITVEVKTYSGTIVYMNGKWWKRQSNGWRTPLKSVSSQARGHRDTVRRHLSRVRSRECSLAGTYIGVEGMIVFVGADAVEAEGLDVAVLRVRDLCDFVQSQPARLSEEQVAALARLFTPNAEIAKPPG